MRGAPLDARGAPIALRPWRAFGTLRAGRAFGTNIAGGSGRSSRTRSSRRSGRPFWAWRPISPVLAILAVLAWQSRFTLGAGGSSRPWSSCGPRWALGTVQAVSPVDAIRAGQAGLPLRSCGPCRASRTSRALRAGRPLLAVLAVSSWRTFGHRAATAAELVDDRGPVLLSQGHARGDAANLVPSHYLGAPVTNTMGLLEVPSMSAAAPSTVRRTWPAG